MQFCSAALAQGAPDILWEDSTTYSYSYTDVAVSPDGQYAATPGSDGVQIWRAADGSRVTSLPHGYWVATLAFSPDGAHLAVSGGSPPVNVWRVSDWSLAYGLSDVTPGPAAFSPDSSLLAVASNNVIELRNAADGALFHRWTNASGEITTLAFSPDGTRIGSGAGIRGRDVTLKMWSVPSGSLIRSITTAQTYHVGCVVFSPDGQRVGTAGGRYAYGPAQVWRVSDGSPVRTFPEGAFALAFSPDGALAVVTGTNLAIYSVNSGAVVSHSPDAGSYYERAVATTPDGRVFLRARFPGHVLAARLPLWITSFSRNGETGVLSWTGGSGRYQLQQRTSLVDGGWEDFGGTVLSRTAEVPLHLPGAFYRVVEAPE